MWKFIETGYEALGPEEKKSVQDAWGGEPKFHGFDGNHESHFHIASFLINEMGRYPHFKDHYLNSHSTSVPGYLRQLERFSSIRPALGRRNLSAQEIVEILQA